MLRNTRVSIALALGMFAITLAGCSEDHSEIGGGNYEAYEAYGHEPADEMLVLATSLSIDRDAASATFTLGDGTVITSSLTSRPRDQWPTGCPGLNTQMEILSLEAPLVIASLEFMEPVLIASCPGGSTEIVLTEDGTSSYGGIPCERDVDGCLFFSPVQN